MEELLNQLGIENYQEKNGSYIVEINDSNEADRIKSKLDRCHAFILDDEASLITYESYSYHYDGEKFEAILLGDLESDTYKLTIKKN